LSFLQEIPNPEFLYVFSEKIALGTLHFSRKVTKEESFSYGELSFTENKYAVTLSGKADTVSIGIDRICEDVIHSTANKQL